MLTWWYAVTLSHTTLQPSIYAVFCVLISCSSITEKRAYWLAPYTLTWAFTNLKCPLDTEDARNAPLHSDSRKQFTENVIYDHQIVFILS